MVEGGPRAPFDAKVVAGSDRGSDEALTRHHAVRVPVAVSAVGQRPRGFFGFGLSTSPTAVASAASARPVPR